MRRPAVLALLLLVATPVWAGEEQHTARRVPLAPGEAAAGSVAGALQFKGALELASPDRRFGGLSGLHVDDDGHAIAVSDRGYFVEFDLVEDAAGNLVDAGAPKVTPMTDQHGVRLGGPERDAEDLAVLPDGRRLVVFEHDPRLGWFAPGTARLERVASLRDLVPGSNEDIESVVALADGRLLLIAEGLRSPEGGLRAWIGRPGEWASLDYVPTDGQQVAGAALLPDGDLLVLERSATVLGGFRARLRRVPGEAIRAGGRLHGESLVELSAPGLADNFEAVATRPLPDGRAAIYLVSDDNYFPLQRTYVVKFETTAR